MVARPLRGAFAGNNVFMDVCHRPKAAFQIPYNPSVLDDKDLVADLLPDVSDRNAAFEFAFSFDGYKHHGSFLKWADAAKSRKRATLAYLRNEVLFEARAS